MNNLTQAAIKGTLAWIPIACATTGVAGLIYIATQQDLRQGANDPQIEIAESAATALNNGATPVSVVPDKKIEISGSLSPYILLYDSQGDFVLGDAVLNAGIPRFPVGLLDNKTWIPSKVNNTTAGEETRVTWQPQEGVREALVLVRTASGGIVVSGRSLRLAEERVGELGQNMLLGWLLTMGASLVFSILVALFRV